MSAEVGASFSERTAWARNLAAPIRSFLRTESGSATVLLAATVAALVWANSPWADSYESVWETQLSIQLGGDGISLDLRHWINEGLMTLFFLVVGLEAKRELDLGALRDRQRLAIPFFAALGGMGIAVLIYLLFNAGGTGANGWAAAMSTDTAFALGVLALVARGAERLRVRLLTLVIIDDLVALLIIATVYSDDLELIPLVLAVVAVRRADRPALRAHRVAYAGGGDPRLGGMGGALRVGRRSGDRRSRRRAVTSAYPPARSELERVTELTRSFREQPTPEMARSAQLGVTSAVSPNERLQYRLHPWTSFVIVPLFALANAGIDIDADLLRDAVTSPITLGITFGYVVGKPVGVVTASWLASRPRLGGVKRSLSWPEIVAAGAVAGIGFTVALLISSIAFEGQQLEEAKLGVIAAAILSSLISWAVFGVIRRMPDSVRARQLAGVADELLDLSEDVSPGRDHIRGSEQAPVTLVEYGDYQCPYCGRAEVVIRGLLDEFGDDLRYVWRHLPLNDVHVHAQAAAEAAEAAGSQGRFWDMHDRLLAAQDELTVVDLTRHAEELGLDMDRFWDELRRREHAGRVDRDVASADASGVVGTPSFFINGRRHSGAYDVASLTRAVEAARERAMVGVRSQA